MARRRDEAKGRQTETNNRESTTDGMAERSVCMIACTAQGSDGEAIGYFGDRNGY